MYMCLYTWPPSGLFYLERLGNLEVDPCWKKLCHWGLDWKGYSLTHCFLCAAEINISQLRALATCHSFLTIWTPATISQNKLLNIGMFGHIFFMATEK